jgi:hypothetical protein
LVLTKGGAVLSGFVSILLLGAGPPSTTDASPTWRSLGNGIDYAKVLFVTNPTHGDGLLHVVRVDPERVELHAVLASEKRVANRTAGEWADALGLVVAMNAGMFQMNHTSNVGYLRNGAHLNNATWSKRYQSVLVFGPKAPAADASSAALIDFDAPGATQRTEQFKTVVQNLRLIKGAGLSVWQKSARRWSEAAIAADSHGRLLFLFTRTPLSMAEFNRRLVQLPLDIVRAMHVEGGPEASLSLRAEGLSLDLSGSYETGFNENDSNGRQWPLPNVIGVSPKTARGR